MLHGEALRVALMAAAAADPHVLRFPKIWICLQLMRRMLRATLPYVATAGSKCHNEMAVYR